MTDVVIPGVDSLRHDDDAAPKAATRRGIGWRRFGRDIVVIILGVLIALAFDNWASVRADRRLERSYLERLERDLRADSAMLAYYHQTAVTGEAAARALLAILGTAPETADSTVAQDFSDATWGAYLSPNSPTIEELKSTGNLEVIRSGPLRDALLTYYAYVAWYQRSFQTIMQRGRDPLAEVGWDIQAFDSGLSRTVDPGVMAPAPGRTALATEASLWNRFRSHPDAIAAARRAVTYNGIARPMLEDLQRRLADLRQELPTE